MNKLPAKQIYLLSIIIIGIIALSVYSTYALFTFETETSDIVSIHTPKSLTISENVYEYQQITLEPNTVTTTDIDIYNTFDYDVCYSAWYKVVGDKDIASKIQVFEKSNNILTASGVLTTSNNIRVTIAIINDHDEQVKVNIGTIGAKKENDSCSLNLATDKNVISSSYQNIETLTEKILKEPNQTKEEKSNYLTYKNIDEIITYKNTDKLYISDKFNYNNEIFKLEAPLQLTLKEISEKKYIENDVEINLEFENIYLCKVGTECSILYKIGEIIEQVPEENEDKEIFYNVKLSDKLIGYMAGINGLRKINDRDYVFYGDNPNNFVYYNCDNPDNTSTCELWRIVGFFYNSKTNKYNTKIIRNNSIGKYQYDSNQKIESLAWSTSTLNKYLTEEYKLKNNYDIYIDEYKQNIEFLPSLEDEITKLEETTNSKINLLNLSDYLYTSSCEKNKISEYNEECLKNNWLNNIEIEKEWTLVLSNPEEIPVEEPTENNENEELTNEEENHDEKTIEDNQNNEAVNEGNEQQEETPEEPIETTIVNYAYSIGNTITKNNVNDSLEVRPVVYLKSRILLLGGEGTLDSPYIIK